MKSLVMAPKSWGADHFVFRALRALRINDPLSRIYNSMLDHLLRGRYGAGIGEKRTGELTVQGATFRFYDPELLYLPAAAFGRNYEPAVTRHLASVLAEGSTFVDIGAEFGFYTAYVAGLNRNCEIFSFEPNRKFFEVLTENIRINGVRAGAYRLALSDSAGEIPFAGRSMKASGRSKPEMVEAIPFDDFRAKVSIRPDVVKIDVHGGEGKVLYGMKDALKNDIRHLYCELHPNELLVDYTMRDVLDILRDSGFELFEINRFRKDEQPALTPIAAGRYEKLTHEETWTPEEIRARRMIYARKRS